MKISAMEMGAMGANVGVVGVAAYLHNGVVFVYGLLEVRDNVRLTMSRRTEARRTVAALERQSPVSSDDDKRS